MKARLYFLLVLLAVFAASCSRSGSGHVSHFVLANGIRVVIIRVAGVNDLAIFSYVPLGLASDAKDKTQWSHMVEHLALNTTGPVTDYTKRNGETMAQGMHFDFMGTRDEFEEGLDLQATWLSRQPSSQEVLDRERPRALGEIATTVRNLFTHKWAIAAWNQVYRHGATRVSIRGPIEAAGLDELDSYRFHYLAPPDRVTLCVIGDIEPDAARAAIERRFGDLESTATAPPPGNTPLPPVSATVPWDIDATHYLETYLVPEYDHPDFAALYVAATLIGQILFTDPELGSNVGVVLSGVDLVTPEQKYLYISASLPEHLLEKVQKRIRHHIDALMDPEANIQIPMYASNFGQRLTAPPDAAAMLETKPENVSGSIVLGNIGLQWGLLEFQYGDYLPRLAKAVRGVTAEDVARVATKYLTKDRRCSLVLTPR